MSSQLCVFAWFYPYNIWLNSAVKKKNSAVKIDRLHAEKLFWTCVSCSVEMKQDRPTCYNDHLFLLYDHNYVDG